MGKQSCSNLISEEKQLSISLRIVRNKKQELQKAYKNCLNNEDKFLFIMKNLKTATYYEFLNDLLFLDTHLTFDDAKIFIQTYSQKLLDTSKIGLIKTKNNYGFYIINV